MATGRKRTRWEEDNELTFNPWAFLVAAIVVGAIAAPIVISVLR